MVAVGSNPDTIRQGLDSGRTDQVGTQAYQDVRALLQSLTPPQITELVGEGHRRMATGSIPAGTDFENQKAQISRIVTATLGLSQPDADALTVAMLARAFEAAKGSGGSLDEERLPRMAGPNQRPGQQQDIVQAGATADPRATPGAGLVPVEMPVSANGPVAFATPGTIPAIAQPSVPFGNPSPEQQPGMVPGTITSGGFLAGLLNRPVATPEGVAIEAAPRPRLTPGQVMTVGPDGRLVAAWAISSQAANPTPTPDANGQPALLQNPAGSVATASPNPAPERSAPLFTPAQFETLMAGVFGNPGAAPSRNLTGTQPSTVTGTAGSLDDLTVPRQQGLVERPWAARWPVAGGRILAA